MDNTAALDAALAQIDRAFGTEPRPLPATMTERVARELARQFHGETHKAQGDALAGRIERSWRSFIPRAQAIFSTMFAPTDEMLNDVEASQDRDDYQDLLTAREQIEHIWQTMLTTAEYELDEDELARKARVAEADRKWREAGCPTDPNTPF